MKPFHYLFFLLVFAACNNDLELSAPRRDIPIVYGLLSRQDTAHYIRIERAFIDPTKSASQVAQIADSLYYKDIVVQLQHSSTKQIFSLQQIDGSKEGFSRQNGTFATAPNYLYKIKNSVLKLEGGTIYKLIVRKNGSESPLTEASTTIVRDMQQLLFNPPNPIPFTYDGDVRLGWITDGSTALFFDVKLRINYEEAPVGSSNFIPKQLEWIAAKNVIKSTLSTNEATTTFIPGVEFYKFLGVNITNSTPMIRHFKGIDLVIEAGGKELYDYLSVAQANAGLSGTETIPTYTNLSNGLGVFSSRNRLILPNYNITNVSKDSLRYGIYTKKLNFQ